MKFIRVTIFFIFFLTSYSFADILPTSLSSHSIAVGNTFNLIIDMPPNNSDNNVPDTSKFQKDFTLVSTYQNQSLIIFNGNTIKKDQWVITLAPKTTGLLIIPSIKIGKHSSAASRINVVDTAQVLTNGKQAIFITASVTPRNPYVQSEILYQLKIYYAINVGAPLIYPPVANNTIIRKLGQDKISITQINGKTYQVFQRNYALFPQKAGKLIINPVIFRGQIPVKTSNQIYNGFNVIDYKPIQLITPEFSITVQPIPATLITQWWLPATDLVLSENWSVSNTMKEGDPITRIVTIKASGLTAAQLPELAINNSDKYNVYITRSNFQDTLLSDKLIATKTFKVVYIPLTQGDITLPAIEVSWWNIITNQAAIAKLPSRTFNIAANHLATAAIESSTSSVAITANNKLNATHKWIYVLTIIGLIMVILLVRHFIFFKKKLPLANNLSLKKSCLMNNPHASKIALINWAKRYFNTANIYSLKDINDKITDSALQQQLVLLEEKLYKQSEMQWNGKELWDKFRKFKNTIKLKEESNISESLPPLYPK